MSTEPIKTLQVFISYSEEDQIIVDKLKQHLRLLQRVQAYEIVESLSGANLILICLSADYLASEVTLNAFYDAFKRREANKAYIVPIFLRPCIWEHTPLSNFQALPLNGVPITLWRDRDAAFSHIVQELGKIMQGMLEYNELIPGSKTTRGNRPPPQAKPLSDTNEPAKKLHLFYCYAREDKELRNYLEIHLKLLKRQYQLTSWHDQEITAGKEWEIEIETHLSTAHIIFLLISPAFMASEYCYTKEMAHALERHTFKKSACHSYSST